MIKNYPNQDTPVSIGLNWYGHKNSWSLELQNKILNMQIKMQLIAVNYGNSEFNHAFKNCHLTGQILKCQDVQPITQVSFKRTCLFFYASSLHVNVKKKTEDTGRQ